MRIAWILGLLLLVVVGCGSRGSSVSTDGRFGTEPRIGKEDLEFFTAVMVHLGKLEDASMAELVAEAGRFFLHTPYGAQTLEYPDSLGKEQLVINLRVLDCTTLVENCLALARTSRSGDHTLVRFAAELQSIRYRQGILDGYASRLHYFCDWISDNTMKGVVKQVYALPGERRLQKTLSFMSSHQEAYPALRGDAALVEQIVLREKVLSAIEYFYLPEEEAQLWLDGLQEGDLVAFTTKIEGLLISHVGLLVMVEGKLRLLHASSRVGEVVISKQGLSHYLEQHKNAMGIILLRPM